VTALRSWLAIGWAALLLSSLVSMMAVFMGSGSGDLHGLLRFQLFLLPVMLLAVAAYIVRAAQKAPDGRGLRLLWRHIPGMMLFAVASALSLTVIAELSFILISLLTDAPRPWLEHIPAATALCSAVALACAYGDLQIGRTDA
jgi:hypothetical protein